MDFCILVETCFGHRLTSLRTASNWKNVREEMQGFNNGRILPPSEMQLFSFTSASLHVNGIKRINRMDVTAEHR